MNVTRYEEVSAVSDHRTEAQKDREARGMVLFNGQEITREAYDRIRGVVGEEGDATDPRPDPITHPDYWKE